MSGNGTSAKGWLGIVLALAAGAAGTTWGSRLLDVMDVERASRALAAREALKQAILVEQKRQIDMVSDKLDGVTIRVDRILEALVEP